MRTRTIAFWTLLFAGFGGSALWASTHSTWVQARMFGPEPRIPPDALGISFLAEQQEQLLYRIDDVSGQKFEDRCKSGKYLIAYVREGIFLNTSGEIIVDGNRLQVNAYHQRAGNETVIRTPFAQEQVLSRGQLDEMWEAVERLRPPSPHDLPPAVDAPEPFHPPFSPCIDCVTMTLAVCKNGSLWAIDSHESGADDPGYGLSRIFHRYLVSADRYPASGASVQSSTTQEPQQNLHY